MIALRFFMLAGNVLWSLGMCCPVWSHCNCLREPTSRRSVCSCQVRTPFAAWARLLQSGVHSLLLWEARPGAKLLLLPGPHTIRREAAPPTGGCTSACVGGPTRDEALAPARPALHSPRGRASYGRGCTSACVGGPPSGQSSYSPRPAHHSPRGRASYTAVCTACFCGRPALGAKLLLLKTSRSAQAGTHVGWALAHHTQRYA